MRSYWSDPYLWVHLAGIATVPLMLELCLMGFAVGDPFLPAWLELLLVGAIGIAPILWMQWQRPFYIFSLLVLSLKPEQLTEDQRRLLTLFKSQRNRIAAVIVPVVLLVALQKVYSFAPIAVSASLFPADWRLVGLAMAAVGFLACNLFTQVPIAVLGVMLRSEADFAGTTPYSPGQIRSNFSVYGFRVSQILPPLVTSAPLAPVAAPAVATPTIAIQEQTDTSAWSELESEALTDTDAATTDFTAMAAATASSTTTELPETNLPLETTLEPNPDQASGAVLEAEVVEAEVLSPETADVVAADVTAASMPTQFEQSEAESATDRPVTNSPETDLETSPETGSEAGPETGNNLAAGDVWGE